MKYTGNYNLKKPEGTDAVNIEDLNDNADIIDSELKKANEKVSTAGDMLKSIYDKNGSGIVDNAEKVNNHTVDADVPSGAKFTDTVTLIANSLTETVAGKALDAVRGKELDGKLVEVTNKVDNLDATAMPVSETVKAIYSLTTDNANVDKALQAIIPRVSAEIVQEVKVSSTVTVPANVSHVDVFLVGGGDDGRGSSGGSGGKIAMFRRIKVVSGQRYPVVIGARNGGITSFDKYSTANATLSTPRVSNAIFDGVNTTPSVTFAQSDTLSNICPFNSKAYGKSGAPGGSTGSVPRLGIRGGNCDSYVGGSAYNSYTNLKVYVSAGGGGAADGANGGAASATISGSGANAAANTGGGGGGYGFHVEGSDSSVAYGEVGLGGSGVCVLRFY